MTTEKMTAGKARADIRSNAKYVRELLRQIEAAAKAGDWNEVSDIANEASCAVGQCGEIAEGMNA